MSSTASISRRGPRRCLDSVGIDTWGVDYGLIDQQGALITDPFCYRDARTSDMPARLHTQLDTDALYARNGTTPQPLQTIFQLMAELGGPSITQAEFALLIPDLLNHWLTGVAVTEVTNASTTGLVNPSDRKIDRDLMGMLSLNLDLFALLTEPGTLLGPARRDRAGAIDFEGVPVVSVASHDTASAVVAMPAQSEHCAFLSCGTWSILGLELPAPVLSHASLAAGFNNELGVDGTVRHVKNMAGLWLLQECLRHWAEVDGQPVSLQFLIAAAATAEPCRTVFNPDDSRFLAPGNMPERVADVARECGEPVPMNPGQMARAIFDSLALAVRRHLRHAMEVTGRDVEVLHMVGGGSQNELLCRLIADATNTRVTAGPSEASALGNALIQIRPLVMPGASLLDLRALLRKHVAVRVFEPEDGGVWPSAERRVDYTTSQTSL